MTDKASFLAGVEFVLRHYEKHNTGGSPFKLTEIDPETWWSQVILRPHPEFMPRSRDHFEARIARWKELAAGHVESGA